MKKKNLNDTVSEIATAEDFAHAMANNVLTVNELAFA
jgi:hypothetical protein